MSEPVDKPVDEPQLFPLLIRAFAVKMTRAAAFGYGVRLLSKWRAASARRRRSGGAKLRDPTWQVRSRLGGEYARVVTNFYVILAPVETDAEAAAQRQLVRDIVRVHNKTLKRTLQRSARQATTSRTGKLGRQPRVRGKWTRRPSFRLGGLGIYQAKVDWPHTQFIGRGTRGQYAFVVNSPSRGNRGTDFIQDGLTAYGPEFLREARLLISLPRS